MTKELLVITSYPQKGNIHGEGTVGIASYAKNTLVYLLSAAKRKNVPLKIKVIAEWIPGQDGYQLVTRQARNDKRVYTEDGIEVQRVWKRGSPFLFGQLLLSVIKNWNTKKILIEFELSMFGGVGCLIFLPLFLFLLRITGKEIYFVSHQAVDDINLLSGHIGINRNGLQAGIINILIGLFYRLTFVPLKKIIVFEEFMKKRLAKFVSEKKMAVIPHGVEEYSNVIERQTARTRLGLRDEFVILYFGFIAWYKGTDWIIKEIKDQRSKIKDKSIKLIVAGGENPNHRNKKFYMDYVKKIKNMAELSNGQIVLTGFVDEKDIPLYFCAADIVVLPYRTIMSSSGPLSLAFSFGKPVSLSQSLKPYTLTDDFADALKSTGADPFAQIGEEDLSLLSKFSEMMREKRSFEHIGELYYRTICQI